MASVSHLPVSGAGMPGGRSTAAAEEREERMKTHRRLSPREELRGRAGGRILGASSKIMHVVRQQNVRAPQSAFYGQQGR